MTACFFTLSYPSFSFCRPLAKEHIRRNRQSRTFLVENVIGEIWSELEEGSVLECPLLFAGFVLCGASRNEFLLVPLAPGENVWKQVVLKTTCPRRALLEL